VKRKRCPSEIERTCAHAAPRDTRPEVVAEILRLHAQGVGVSSIAVRLSILRSRVARVLAGRCHYTGDTIGHLETEYGDALVHGGGA
jgi:hypothetical protein